SRTPGGQDTAPARTAHLTIHALGRNASRRGLCERRSLNRKLESGPSTGQHSPPQSVSALSAAICAAQADRTPFVPLPIVNPKPPGLHHSRDGLLVRSSRPGL